MFIAPASITTRAIAEASLGSCDCKQPTFCDTTTRRSHNHLVHSWDVLPTTQARQQGCGLIVDRHKHKYMQEYTCGCGRLGMLGMLIRQNALQHGVLTPPTLSLCRRHNDLASLVLCYLLVIYLDGILVKLTLSAV